MVNKKILVSGFMILLMSSSIASASLFDDLIKMVQPVQIPIQKNIIENQKEQFYVKLLSLNSPTAISNLNKEMDDYNVKVLKVRIYKTPWNSCGYCGENFYIVRGTGVVLDYPTNDMEVVLTYNQINRMIPFFTDGKIDWFERFQLLAIYKVG